MTSQERWYRVKKTCDPDLIELALSKSVAQSSIANYANDRLAPPFNLYKEDEEYYYFPTFIGRQIFGLPEDHRECGEPLSERAREFRGVLQESRFQIKAVDACVKALQETGGAILHKGCGLGKTVDALAVVSRLGVRAGILVDKSFLMNQWIERLAEYLPNCKVGIARGKWVDLECDVVIVMAKTQSMYKYDFPGVGLWIVDECHKFCATTLSECLPSVASRYMLALSATPERADGLHNVLYAWFDRIVFSAQREGEIVEVYKIQIQKEPAIVYLKNGKLNLAAMINYLAADEDRNKVIGWHLVQQLNQGRRILLLSDRREHLRELEITVQQMAREFRPAGPAGPSGSYKWNVPELADLGLENLPTIDYYVGGRKPEELAQAEKADLILATFQMAKEALDLKPPPDTLFLATPKADIVQAIGRMRLEFLNKTARILDFVDHADIYYGLANKRSRIYNQRKYEIVSFSDCERLGRQEPEVIDDEFPE